MPKRRKSHLVQEACIALVSELKLLSYQELYPPKWPLLEWTLNPDQYGRRLEGSKMVLPVWLLRDIPHKLQVYFPKYWQMRSFLWMESFLCRWWPTSSGWGIPGVMIRSWRKWMQQWPSRRSARKAGKTLYWLEKCYQEADGVGDQPGLYIFLLSSVHRELQYLPSSHYCWYYPCYLLEYQIDHLKIHHRTFFFFAIYHSQNSLCFPQINH